MNEFVFAYPSVAKIGHLILFIFDVLQSFSPSLYAIAFYSLMHGINN